MNNRGTIKNPQEDVPISFPPVDVSNPIESNENLEYTSVSDKQEEFSNIPLYSGNISYSIVSQPSTQRETETLPSNDLNPMGTDIPQQSMDYSSVSTYGLVFSNPNSNRLSHTVSFSSGMPQASNHGMKDINIRTKDSSHLISYQQISTNNSIPIQPFHPPQDKNASLTDSTTLDPLYYSSEPSQSQSTTYLPSSDINDLNSENHLNSLSTEKRRNGFSLSKPKRIRTAYNFFSKDYFNLHKDITANHESIKDVANTWKDLSEEQRNHYRELSEEDKKRYSREYQLFEQKFDHHGLPMMSSKRERQSYLYRYITEEQVKNLAHLIVLLHNDNIDYSLAFIESVLKCLNEKSTVSSSYENDSGNLEISMNHSSSTTTTSTSNTSNGMIFKCYYQNCNKEFHSLRSLNQHKLSHSQITEKFTCPFPGCDRVFTTMSGLRKHKQNHNENRIQYKCQLCAEQKVFKTKEGLLLHQKNKHTSQRKYVCTEIGCDKSFARKEDLRLHNIRVHSHTKPYQCTIEGCGKSFASSSELKRHSRLHQA